MAYGDKPVGPFIGQHVTYVLSENEALQYKALSAPATISWAYTESTVDLNATVNGQTLYLKNVSQGTSPGNWY